MGSRNSINPITSTYAESLLCIEVNDKYIEVPKIELREANTEEIDWIKGLKQQKSKS